MYKIVFVVLPYLTLLSASGASGASFTTCSILNGTTGDVILQSNGVASCSLELPSAIGGLPHRANAAFLQGQIPGLNIDSWTGFSAGSRAFSGSDDQSLRFEAQAYGSGQDYAFFSNIAPGNFFEIDFNLTLGAADTFFQFSLGGQQFNNRHGKHSVRIPINAGFPVSIDPYLRVFCYVTGNANCSAATSYGITSLDVVNAAGQSQAGYLYGFSSGIMFSPSDITFPGGENVAYVPEPGSVALVLMGLAVLVEFQRRRSTGSM